MKIAIFGSIKTNQDPNVWPLRDREGFKFLCERLGQYFARSPYVVRVESDRDRTADKAVVAGFLRSSERRGRIEVFWRSDKPRPFNHEAGELGASMIFVTLDDQRVSPAHLRMLRDRHRAIDVVIVIGGGPNTYNAGLAAAQAGTRLLPIGAFGGAGERLSRELDALSNDTAVKIPTLVNRGRLNGRWEDVTSAVIEEISSLPQVMIVHGRSPDKDDVIPLLTSMGLRQPLVLAENFDPGSTIPEKFEIGAQQVDAAIALFTPDDEAAPLLNPSGKAVDPTQSEKRLRARQNVCLEYGWFWGRLGRDRVLLLLKGGLELPSDVSGLLYEEYTRSPLERKAEIQRFVENIRVST